MKLWHAVAEADSADIWLVAESFDQALEAARAKLTEEYSDYAKENPEDPAPTPPVTKLELVADDAIVVGLRTAEVLHGEDGYWLALEGEIKKALIHLDEPRNSIAADVLREVATERAPSVVGHACRVCGCTEHVPCHRKDSAGHTLGTCSWIQADLCTACDDGPTRGGYWLHPSDPGYPG